MALISRNAEENFFNSLPTELHDDLIKNYYDHNESDLTFLSLFFNFSLGVVGKRYLASRGIRLSPIGGTVTHSHPICKIIENHFLYVSLPQLLSKSKRFALMSIKENKAQYIYKRNEQINESRKKGGNFGLDSGCNKPNEAFKLVNRIFEPKDYARYEDVTEVRCPFNNRNWFDVVGNLLGLKSGVDLIFIHDEVHHWSKSDMAYFLSSTEVENLVFTVVFPPEVLLDQKNSMNPSIYSFEVDGDDIFFFPDASNSIPYQQSKEKGMWLLRCGQMAVTTRSGQRALYSFQMLENHGAHSLFICTRRKVKTESKRFFKDFEASDLSSVCKEDVILKDRGRKGSLFCSHDLLEKVVNYIVCLKKPDVESALAKLRQLTDSACHPDEVYILHNIMASFIACKDFFEKGILSFASLSVKSLLSAALQLAPSIESLIGATNLSRWRFLRSLFMNLRRFQVVVDTEFIDGDLSIQDEGRTRIQKIHGQIFRGLVNSYRALSSEFSSLQGAREPSPYYSCKRLFALDLQHHGQTFSIGSDQLIFFDEANEQLREKFSNGVYSLIICLCIKSLREKWAHGFLEYGNPNEVIAEPELQVNELSTDKSAQMNEGGEKEEGVGEDTPSPSKILKEEGDYSKNVTSAREKEDPISDVSRKNSCFIRAISAEINLDPDLIIRKILSNRESAPPSLIYAIEEDLPISVKDLDFISKLLDLRVTMLDGEGVLQLGANDEDKRSVTICKRRGHAFNLPGPALSKERFLNGLAYKVSDSFFSTSRNPEFFSSFDFSINIKSASLLIDSMFHNDFGALLDRSKIKRGGLLSPRLGDPTNFISSLRSFGDKFKILTKTMILPVLGFAGSGKTSSLLKILHDINLKNFEWISPRSELLKDLKFGNENSADLKNFSTFEIGLSRSKEFNRLDNIVIVLDEVFLLPNGFVDLMVLNILISFEIDRLTANKGMLKLHPKELEGRLLDFFKKGVFERIGPEILIIALGDPLQTKFFSSEAPSLNRARSFREVIGGSETKNYLNYSRRFGEFLNNSFDLSLNPVSEPLVVKIVSSLDSVCPEGERFGVMVASQEDKKKYSFNFDKISTIGESQGRTFDESLLVLTRSIYKSDKETILTALTRARKRVWIWVPKDMEGNLKGPGEGAILLNNVLAKNGQGVFEIINSMKSGLRLFNFEEKLGSDFELKTEGDLFLRSNLSFISRKDIAFDENNFRESADEGVREPKMKVHISLAPQNFSMLESSCYMRSREFRELKDGSIWSEQFNDTFKMGGFNSDSFNQSMAPSAVFPRHQSSDSVTFWSAVKKRLVFKDPYSNLRNAEKAGPTGKIMLQVFLDYVKLNPDWDQNLYDEAKLEFEEKKISKSSALISNHAIRSDSDWPKENFFLFMKNQSCKKLEKMFCDGKAGQTLACFSHSVLLRFGPLNRYIEKKVSSSLPGRFYIHQKKNFEDLEKWVIKENFDQECTESDYEAFDASQDHFALAFEIELMKFLQIPDDLIDDYRWLKCHTHCRLGNMAIMRFTGEFCTFMFNTLINMVFTFLAYDISDASICFAGDDMCANRRLRRQSKFSSILDNFSLKAKVDFTYSPSFCGWKLFKSGIVKSPTLVAARVEMAKQKTVGGPKGFTSNDIALVCDSYFLEVIFTYRKGDLIFELLSEREMYHFYNVMRFFVKYKRYLSPASRSLLESDKESNMYLGGEVGSNFLFNNFRDCMLTSYANPLEERKGKFKIEGQCWSSSFSQTKLSANSNVGSNCGNGLNLLGLRSFCENLTTGPDFKTKLGSWNIDPAFTQISESFRCQSLMGESFSSSRLDQIKKFLLMGSLIPVSTAMLEASRERLQILSRDSKSTLQSQLRVQKGQLQSIFHSSMILKGRLLLSRMITSAFYIIRLSSSLSLGFLTRLVRWKENSSYSMREPLESKLLSRKGSLSILAEQIGHITSTALIPLCRSLTRISLSLSSYALNSLALTLSLGRTASLLISGSCIDCSITQMMDFARLRLDKVSFRNFRQLTRSQTYKVLSTSMNCAFMRIDQFRILVTKKLSPPGLMVFLEEGKKKYLESGGIGLTQFLNKLGQFNSRLMKNFLDFLDQTLVESLGEFLLGYQRGYFESFWLERQEKMSIKNMLENEMKEGIQDYVWRNVIDSTNQMNMSPAVGTNLTQELAERKAFILRHFFKYLAGNLAVEGTSEQTKYPDHTIRLPPIPAARLGGTENLALEMNMVETIGAMRAWRDSLPANHPNRNATLRQMATPFADHALEFLVEHANDVKTNLAASHPELAKAPEVAFDFARGLSPRHTVHALRAQTIGAFTGRTFRTEGQKGVFTAQGTVNVSYDG